MIVYNHEQIYTQLKQRIKTLCDKLFEPNIPFTIRGASNQKLSETYIQLYFKQWNKIGKYNLVTHNQTAMKYEVMVDISVHRPPTATTEVGSTSIKLGKILHAFDGHSGTYLDSFPDGNISYLRGSTITMRHWPIDRNNQLEERSTVTCIFEVVVYETDPTDVGWIDTVELTTKVDDESNSSTINYPS